MTADILCEHRHRITTTSQCAAIPKEVWITLKQEYQGEEISSKEGPCDLCADTEEALRKIEEMKLQEREKEKKVFMEIYKGVQQKKAETLYHLLDCKWVAEWKEYIDTTGEKLHTESTPSAILSDRFICTHGLLLYDPSLLFEKQAEGEASPEFMLVHDSTWKALVDQYPFKGVDVTCQQVEGSIITDPEVCQFGCVEHQRELDLEAKLAYQNQHIFVVKRESDGGVESNGNRKSHHMRTRTAGSLVATYSNHTDTKTKLTGVSATDTLHTLKLKIFQELEIIPIQQKLSKGGTVLEQDDFTLAQYNIIPGTTLMLEKIQENQELLDESRPEVEEGFKGTVLHSIATRSPASSSSECIVRSGLSFLTILSRGRASSSSRGSRRRIFGLRAAAKTCKSESPP